MFLLLKSTVNPMPCMSAMQSVSRRTPQQYNFCLCSPAAGNRIRNSFQFEFGFLALRVVRCDPLPHPPVSVVSLIGSVCPSQLPR